MDAAQVTQDLQDRIAGMHPDVVRGLLLEIMVQEMLFYEEDLARVCDKASKTVLAQEPGRFNLLTVEEEKLLDDCMRGHRMDASSAKRRRDERAEEACTDRAKAVEKLIEKLKGGAK